MIARRVFITCDAEPYCAAELPADDSGLPTVEDVRREARKAGWAQTIAGDYCPAHRPARRQQLDVSSSSTSADVDWRRRHGSGGELSTFASYWLGGGRRSADTPAGGERGAWPVW